MPERLIVNTRLVNEGRECDGDLRMSRGRTTRIGRGLAWNGSRLVGVAQGRWLGFAR